MFTLASHGKGSLPEAPGWLPRLSVGQSSNLLWFILLLSFQALLLFGRCFYCVSADSTF
jgi:hypothetical protein